MPEIKYQAVIKMGGERTPIVLGDNRKAVIRIALEWLKDNYAEQVTKVGFSVAIVYCGKPKQRLILEEAKEKMQK